jgi:hypothetical protein
MRTFARITGPTTALLFGLAVGPTLLTAQVSASGFGVRVTRSVGGLAPTPSVALAGARNLDGATVDQVSLPGTLQTGLISTISTGASDPAVTGSQTTSTVAEVDILNGLIRADQLVASASSVVSGGIARSDAQGSSVSGLVVRGTVYGEQLPPPNTRVDLPGVGYAILNEQVVTGNGSTRSGITVNLIHVYLDRGVSGSKSGEIVLGSASSSVAR